MLFLFGSLTNSFPYNTHAPLPTFSSPGSQLLFQVFGRTGGQTPFPQIPPSQDDFHAYLSLRTLAILMEEKWCPFGQSQWQQSACSVYPLKLCPFSC